MVFEPESCGNLGAVTTAEARRKSQVLPVGARRWKQAEAAPLVRRTARAFGLAVIPQPEALQCPHCALERRYHVGAGSRSSATSSHESAATFSFARASCSQPWRMA